MKRPFQARRRELADQADAPARSVAASEHEGPEDPETPAAVDELDAVQNRRLLPMIVEVGGAVRT